jgi:hypothetical protein
MCSSSNELGCGGCVWRWDDCCICSALRGDPSLLAATPSSQVRDIAALCRPYGEGLYPMKWEEDYPHEEDVPSLWKVTLIVLCVVGAIWGVAYFTGGG